jgi:thioredoxin-like negative regulator of GroEL
MTRYFLTILLVPAALLARPAIKEVTSMNEFQAMMNNKKDACVIFYAPWCQACNSMKDTFNTAAEKYKDSLEFVKVDASSENLKEAVDMFGVQAIPTIFFKHIGFQDKERFMRSLDGFVGKVQGTQKQAAKKSLPKTPSKKYAQARRKIAHAPRKPLLRKKASSRPHKV